MMLDIYAESSILLYYKAKIMKNGLFKRNISCVKFKMISCEMILNTPNVENIGISVAELWGVENPDTFTIDTSITR